MSSVTPPPPPPPPANPPTPTPSVFVSDPPPALLKLDVGAKIDAQLLGIDNRGLRLAETTVGQIAFRTYIDLPSSGPIQLQVQSLGNQVLLLITAIHGKSPAVALRAPNAISAPPLPNHTHLGKVSTFTLPETGEAVSLFKLDSTSRVLPERPGSTSVAPVTLTQGSFLGATLLQTTTALSSPPSTTLPHTHTPPTTIAPIKSTTTDIIKATSKRGYAGPTTTGSAGLTRGSNTIILAAGTSLMVKVLSVQPGSGMPQSTPTMQPISAGIILEGTVSGSGTSSQAIVQTQAGQIALNTAIALPVGTKVEFQITQLQLANKTTHNLLVNDRLGQIIAESGQWPTLQESIQLLKETNPVTAQQLLNSVFPRLDNAFVANILFFLFALRAGDIRHWLGDAPTRTLTQLKPTLLRRLRDDFTGLKRVAEERSSKEGRLFSIPLANGSHIEQIRLWVHHQNEDADENEGAFSNPGIRFVIDVNLSSLGRVQLDGFVEDATKRFHLIVRTDKHLSSDIQHGIRTVFENANDNIGVICALAFQSAPANFIEITKGLKESELGLIV